MYSSGMKTDTITITLKEYNSLLEDSALLAALEAAGVDNWEGYSDAVNAIDEEEEMGA